MTDRRRLFRAQHQDISVLSEVGDGRYFVEGTRDIEYQVDPQNPSCTCPDWEKREPVGGCKHILAVKLHKGEIDPIQSSEATYGARSQSGSRNIPNWDSLASRTKKRDNWTCQKCGKEGGEFGTAELHVHHIRPRSQGGDDTLDNLITLCQSCHEELHGHSIPTQDRYGSSSNKKRSDPHADLGTQNTESRADEGRVKCKSCGTIFKQHSTMDDLCDNCLADRAPNHETDGISPQQPSSSSRTPSEDRAPHSTETAKDDSEPTSTEESTKQESFSFIGFLLLIIGAIGLLLGWEAFTSSSYLSSMIVFIFGIYSAIGGIKLLTE